jgi:hypothetical protein
MSTRPSNPNLENAVEAFLMESVTARRRLPIAAAAGDSGATPLQAAAWAGSAEVIQQLLASGAALEAPDSTWNATPLEWALVGSGERRSPNPTPNWVRPSTCCWTQAPPPIRSSSTPPIPSSRAPKLSRSFALAECNCCLDQWVDVVPAHDAQSCAGEEAGRAVLRACLGSSTRY